MEDRLVKVRFLAQGIMTIPEGQLPPNFDKMTREEAWEWIQVWWDEQVTMSMIHQGLIDCDSDPYEVSPGLLEVYPPQGDYETLAQSNEYRNWWMQENATALFTGDQ